MNTPSTQAGGKAPAVVTSALLGVLTRVGTFTVGTQDVTGYLIECHEDTLAKVKHLPMYRCVEIMPESEVAKLRSLLQQMLDVAENCDETGYAADVGFVDIDKLHEKVRAALSPNKTDQQRDER